LCVRARRLDALGAFRNADRNRDVEPGAVGKGERRVSDCRADRLGDDDRDAHRTVRRSVAARAREDVVECAAIRQPR
jgi:hypothetical protein